MDDDDCEQKEARVEESSIVSVGETLGAQDDSALSSIAKHS